MGRVHLIISYILAITILCTTTTALNGTGTTEDPYQITTLAELNETRNNLTANYILMTDIDASNTTNWDTGLGFTPIGNTTDPFTGTFNGAGYTITALYINRTTDNTGLFGLSQGTITNLNLNANITGANSVGGIIGYNQRGNVTSSTASGTITGNNKVGGLIGYNVNGTISNSTTTTTVTGAEATGGLIGWSQTGNITNSSTTGNITGTSSSTGGLIGYTVIGGTIQNSYTTGQVTGPDKVGGLIGNNNAIIQNCTTNATIQAEYDTAGNLIGYNSGTINNSYSTGTTTTPDSAGGLTGVNSATGTINNSYSTGTTTGTTNIGGLVGVNVGKITKSYTTSTTTGNENIGGFAGYNTKNITESYSTGNTTGNISVGGFIGYNAAGTINNTYTQSTVTGPDAAGFAGTNDATISNSYAIGTVTGTNGFTTTETGTTTNSFWDTQTTGQTNSTSATGKTTTQMKTNTTFIDAEWDFDNIWHIQCDQPDYPKLLWQVSNITHCIEVTVNTTITQTNDNGHSKREQQTKTITETKTTLNLKVNDKQQFKISGETHTMTLNFVTANEAKITLQSEPITLTLKLKETQYIDLNKDGQNDIQLRYDGIVTGTVKIFFELLPNIKPTPEIIQEIQKITENIPTYTQQETPPQETKQIQQETTTKTKPDYTALWIIILTTITLGIIMSMKCAREL